MYKNEESPQCYPKSMDLYSPKQAAQILGVKTKTIYNWINQGKMSHLKLGGTKFGRVRIKGSEINKKLVGQNER